MTLHMNLHSLQHPGSTPPLLIFEKYTATYFSRILPTPVEAGLVMIAFLSLYSWGKQMAGICRMDLVLV